MPTKINYTISYEQSKLSPLVRFVVIPISIIALIFLSVGIYTFISANKIMRQEPKQLEDFANNILPSYSLASFTSLDNVTYLSGWFFRTKLKPVSTVIFVHDNGNNRLQFDVDTASLIEFFTDNGFNVLAFDLRHSGSSKGNLSTFGYSEWEDVISAISYVKKNSVTKDVILCGFGSGASASLMALDYLEKISKPSTKKNTSNTEVKSSDKTSIKTSKVSSNVTNSEANDESSDTDGIDFDKAYIRGLILDSPSLSCDDYIKAVSRTTVFGGKYLGQYTIPYAVRLSAGANKNVNLAAILARTQLPVHLISKKSADIQLDSGNSTLISERVRLFPTMTTLYKIESVSNLSSYIYNIKDYQAALLDYLTKFIFS